MVRIGFRCRRVLSQSMLKRSIASSSGSSSSSKGGQGQAQMDKNLLKAAASGDSASMKDMASRDPSILLGRTPVGNTCLHISSIYGREEFCKDVLKLEESLLVTVKPHGETPLIAAVRNGHISLGSFLLGSCRQAAFRQAILQQDRYGHNALHHAILCGHKDLALELIEAEPALSQAVTKCNESPLFFAQMRCFAHLSKKLMENPYCAYSGGVHGYNSLHAAVQNDDQEIAKIIIEKCPELATQGNKATPVRRAVLDGKLDMLRVMLEHDSTLGYEIDSKGFSLLASAAFRGRVAAAQEILRHCPDAAFGSPDGRTILHDAVIANQRKFVEFILRTPALRKLVNMPDDNGKTALHYAVNKCNPKIVVDLLSHEDIDASLLDNTGRPAAWDLTESIQNAKTLNWNEVIMLMSKAYPQGALSLHNLVNHAKDNATKKSRMDAKPLTQTYTANTSLVAILVTTITFAAAFTLPGGSNNASGSEGLPIMFGKAAFKVFLISDVLAMCSSFTVAFICIIARWEDYEFLIHYRSFTKKLMWFAYAATTTAFSTGLYTVLAPCLHWLAIAICALVAFLPVFTWLLGNWPVLKLRYRLGKSFNSDLLDMV